MNQMFSMLVSRMSLAGKDNLHGTPLIEHHGFDSIQIVKKQCRPFVTGKTTSETDGEGFRIQERTHGDHLPRIDAILGPAFARSFASEREELALQEQVNVPDFFVWIIHHAVP